VDNKTNYHHRTSSRSQPHQAAVSRCGVPAVARGSGHRLDNVDSWWSIAVSRDHDTRRQLCVVDWWATSGRRHETTDNLHYAAASSRLTLYSAKLIIVPHRIICSWHAGRWLDGWTVTFCTARRKLGGAAARPGLSSLYQM